jgi:hypothetical protein
VAEGQPLIFKDEFDSEWDFRPNLMEDVLPTIGNCTSCAGQHLMHSLSGKLRGVTPHGRTFPINGSILFEVMSEEEEAESKTSDKPQALLYGFVGDNTDPWGCSAKDLAFDFAIANQDAGSTECWGERVQSGLTENPAGVFMVLAKKVCFLPQ